MQFLLFPICSHQVLKGFSTCSSSKNKTLLKFLCFCCIVEVFVASSLPRFLSYCNYWVFCYIVITIVSLKLYHFYFFLFLLLRFLLYCWALYCNLLLQNVGIVVVVIAMVIVSKVFVFFHHIFFFLFCINFQAISPNFLLQVFIV